MLQHNMNTKYHDKSKNNIANPRLQYNYSNNNYIPELFTVNSCWNGVNILASHKCGTLVTVVWKTFGIKKFRMAHLLRNLNT